MEHETKGILQHEFPTVELILLRDEYARCRRAQGTELLREDARLRGENLVMPVSV